jgi:rubrerythrin
MFTTDEIFDLAIRIERNGEKFYRDVISRAESAELREALQWLADEEVRHAQFFAKLKEESKNRERTVPREDGVDNMLLQDLLGDRVFSLDDLDFSSLSDLRSLLRHAVEFEKDTILFFEMIKPFVEEDAAMEQLEAIIEEERRHVVALEGLPAKVLIQDGRAIARAPLSDHSFD